MKTITQIERGILVCPSTRRRLHGSNDRQWLVTDDDAHRYRFLDGEVPILLADPDSIEKYASASKKMNEEYSPEEVENKNSLFSRLRQFLNADYRTESSKHAFDSLFAGLSGEALCISIGGGPARAHRWLTNINIGPFPNVDIVADAHYLPYADGSVDAIYSEAVFEHLHDPNKAAEEICRVLKPGKKVFICTPFMFPYHGYPDHYQNYTLSGLKHLFESAGMKIIESGCCVGPVFTVTNLVNVFLREYSPRLLRFPLRLFWSMFSIAVRPLDKIIGKSPNAHVLASTNYIVAEKIV